MHFSQIAALLFVCVAVPNVPRSQLPRTDADRLQGVWKITSWTKAGQQGAAFVENTAPTVAFQGDRYVWSAGTASESGKFRLGASGRLRTIDLLIADGKDAGKVQRGIYEVDGDQLKVCFAAPGVNERPATFTSRANAPEYILATLKRQAKDTDGSQKGTEREGSAK